ncbi:putative het domain-containing protein [Botrytis fragariae]|uniref:Putative het domain-containing protein n=1 Tax=Botrytis fragariae TaxID=1964551 RepID=A0A8H6B4R1_9HELO|nr:putative het domain-containing protein [Botrytis fragariae]KAF5878982.1 putative het domain-containing protein [Botrytis fragariae]
MRLINTTTYEFSEFHGDDIPKYAVLSHTLEHDEVTFQKWAFSRRKAEKKAGYAKIEATCKLALKIGLMYAWMDTCCNDKSSSAELSEAINFMFAWYAGAIVCFAFLADIVEGEVEKVGSQLGRKLREGLNKSR